MSIYLYTTRLPNTYQEVEYIQSTATDPWSDASSWQYIDTLVTINKNIKVDIDMQFTSLAVQSRLFWWLYDSWSSWITFSPYINWSTQWARATSNWTWNWQSTSVAANTNRNRFVLDNTRYIIYNSSWTQVYNGTNSSTISNSDTWTIPLLASKDRSLNRVSRHSSAKLYWCKIWDNDVLVRDFIPCYRKSDNVIWLYDLVNDQFYTNAWTWNFTKWNDIIGEIEIKTMYIWEYVNLDPITFSYTGSDQHRTVPYTGTYRITCKWAWSNTAAWWLWQWELQLTQWDEYTIVVWQKWSATSWTTYWFWGSSNYSSNRAWWWLSWFFTGSTTVAATDSARALVIGGWAGWGQSSSRAWWKWGWETWQNWQWSNYWTAWGWWTQTWRNSWWNVWANQFNGWNWSRTYWWWWWGWWWWWNGSIWDGSWDDDKWAGGWSGYVISTASNRVLTQGWWSATWTDWSVLIEFIPS